MNQNLTTGFRGESVAATYLVKLGYKIIDTNYRSGRWGELDIIATHNGDLVFVEVKTRSHSGYGNPIEAVTASKMQRLHRTAEQYILTHANLPSSCHFEVITLQPTAAGWHIQLYKDIPV